MESPTASRPPGADDSCRSRSVPAVRRSPSPTAPPAAAVTTHVSNDHVFRLDLEIRGQGQHRRAAAQAALSRTEWEVAFQEMTVGVRVARAFDALLYRREKLRLLDEIIRLQEQ